MRGGNHTVWCTCIIPWFKSCQNPVDLAMQMLSAHTTVSCVEILSSGYCEITSIIFHYTYFCGKISDTFINCIFDVFQSSKRIYFLLPVIQKQSYTLMLYLLPSSPQF